MKSKEKEGTKSYKYIILVVIVLLIIAGAIYYLSSIFSRGLESEEEFNDAIYNCRRANYIYDGDTAAWLYKIKGEKNGKCFVYAKLLTAKEGIQDVKELEGKDMMCSLPLGVVIFPEENLKECHGLLKEGLQDLLIEKMHSYITQNLEQVSEDFRAL